MGDVQVRLPAELKSIIDRFVSEGRVGSEAAYPEEAIRRLSDEFDAEHEILAIADAGIAAIEKGDFVTISCREDVEALHERTMAKLRGRLADDEK